MKNKNSVLQVMIGTSVGILTALTASAADSRVSIPADQVVVSFKGQALNLLELVAEDELTEALSELTFQACYRGDANSVVQKLNGVFRMVERSDQLARADFSFRLKQATTRKLTEPVGSIGVEYQPRVNLNQTKRYVMAPCSPTTPIPTARLRSSLYQLNVSTPSGQVNLLTLVAEDEQLAALRLLNTQSCFKGDSIEVLQRLNGVFNMAAYSDRVRSEKWPFSFKQATTPKLDEIPGSIGIELEMRSGDYAVKRFLIQNCQR